MTNTVTGAKTHHNGLLSLSADYWILGLGVFAFFALMGTWRAFVVQQSVGDALSRTYSAFVTLYSHEPHLGAIGFVWPPLPALAQLPVLALFPSAAYYGFSGNLVSAASAGLMAPVMLHLLRAFGLGRWTSGLSVVMLFANPMMAFYASNGMSEMPFLLFLTIACDAYWVWERAGQWRPLAIASFACAAMFLCRYDGAIVAAVMAGSIMLVMLINERTALASKMEANLLAFCVPVAYVGMMWIYFNWVIMGDPLYFYQSEYSNVFLTRQMAQSPEVQQLQRSLFAVAGYLLNRLNSFSPFFTLGCIAGVGLAIVRRHFGVLCVMAILLATPLFQLQSYWAGATFPLMRFYISVIPSGLILGAYLCFLAWRSAHDRLTQAILLSGMLLSNVASFSAMLAQPMSMTSTTGTVGDERWFLESLRQPLVVQNPNADDRAAAQYLVQHAAGRSILVDSSGATVVLFSQRPNLFYLLSDSDWNTVARAPIGRVKYIVIVNRATIEYHALLGLYPDLYERGTAFAELAADFGPVRIYRVKD